MKKSQKSTGAKSRKTQNSPYRASKIRQKQVRKQGVGVNVSLDRKHLKINLGHLVTHYATGRKRTLAYEIIAASLSKVAGLQADRCWSWRYVASVNSGSVEPSKKFLSALALCLQNISPRQKQWFYFVRRGSVAAFYDRSMLGEMIRARLKELGYRPTTYSRYMQARRAA